MSARRGPRGFTLLELMVSTAIAAVAAVAITAAFVSQARQYHAQANRSAVQASARQGLDLIEDSLRTAGFGVDPDRVFLAYDGFDPAAPNAPVAGRPDALTVHARDPLFRRRVVSVSNTKVTWEPKLTEPLREGQILLLLCWKANDYRYVTVGETTAADATEAQLSTVPAAAESPVSRPGLRFHQLQANPAEAFDGSLPGCLNASTPAEPAFMVKVDRASFYVDTFDDDDDPKTPPTPYLMLHRGIDVNGQDGVTADDAVPVAAGVEQLQVAYVMNSPPVQVGAQSAIPLLLGVQEDAAHRPPWGDAWYQVEPLLERPKLDFGYSDPARYTNHPANVRQVRVSLVARGPRPNEGLPGDDANTPAVPWAQGPALGDGQLPWRQLENLGVPATLDPNGGGYARTVLRISVAPRNLTMRQQFLPLALGGG